MENKDKINFASIEALIQKEKEEAFRLFQQSDFEVKLKKRIMAKEDKINVIWLGLKKPVIIVGLGVLIVCMAVISLTILFSLSPQKNTLEDIEQFFKRSPGFQRLVKSQEGRNFGQTKEYDQDYLLESKIKNVFLSSLKKEHTSSEKITFSWEREKSPKLDLNKKIEILIRQQSVQRWLSRYLIKFEEEKNDQKNISYRFSLPLLSESLRS